MTPDELSVMRMLMQHLRNNADRCRADAVAAESVYYRHHLLGRATAFDDCAYMILSRWPEVNE